MSPATYLDLMKDIERLSVPVPDMLERLADAYISIPPLAQKLVWCRIPDNEREAVIARLRELATIYSGLRSPMAGSIATSLGRAGRTLALPLPPGTR